MSKIPSCFLSFLLISFLVQGQDYQKMAADLQHQFKDAEAANINSEISYEFSPDYSASGVKVLEKKNEKLLSLRYNYTIQKVEVYDSNSKIEKFYAESSLKQRATEETKTCGNYTNEGYFYDDSKFCLHYLKLKEVGEVWNVSCLKRMNDAKYLTSVYFEEHYPIVEKKITFSIPQGIDVEIREFNLIGFSISKLERMTGTTKIIEYTAKNMAGIENVNLSRGMQYNHPHLLVLVKSINLSGKKVNVLSSTDDLYSWYSSLTKSLKPESSIFKSTVDGLVKDKKTDEDKIRSIYYWVQDNIRYIAFENGIAGFKPDEAQNVFEKKYGDCKGMANLTKEMLKVAGYDARLTWIGTKKIMYDYSIPSLSVDNHMICTVFLGQKKYYLDATEKYIPFGENAERIQNRPVMIEDGDKFILDKVPESEKFRDTELRQMIMSVNGEELQGTYKVTLNGEVKKNFLYGYNYTQNDKKGDFISDYITDKNKNLKISKLKLPNLEERSGSLILECAYTFVSAISSFNNEYYLDLDPAKYLKNWDVKETRQSDMDFGEKLHKKYFIELQIPEGFKIASLPENLTISDPEFSFIINYKAEGNKIIYNKELIIHQGIIKKSSFSKWNAAIKQLTRAYENQIVLKK
jgi:hypothetical protein